MRRKNDPKADKARSELYHAQLWVEILSKGIGHTISDVGYRCVGETIRPIIDLVTTELLAAVEAADAAKKAMEPYWQSRRVRATRTTKKKKAAAK